MADVECVHEGGDQLGEGVMWHGGEGALYWVDIPRPALHRLDPASGAVKTWTLPAEVGSFAFRKGGGIVAAGRQGFGFLDAEAGTLEPIADPEAGEPATRLNDGKCDRAGRFWAGGVDDARQPRCGLYRLDAAGGCTRMEQGITVSNGIAWSPDSRVMYFADSAADSVYAYDFDLGSGEVANRRVFISTKEKPEWVDGATVDADGFYWCAHIFAGEIARYDPAGKLERTIPLPVTHPTMCTFGGPNLDVLYVTSTKKFLKPEQAAAQPLAGGLFAIHNAGARGLPEPQFAG